ncbi:MAG: hypothetical protein BRD33_03670, partial [Bacteroidetes bacterium QH_6_63_17]
EDLLRSTPGVGEETTARTLLGRLPGLGNANRREIAKLVGMAPIAQENGTWKGERPHLKSAGTLHSFNSVHSHVHSRGNMAPKSDSCGGTETASEDVPRTTKIPSQHR